MAKDYFQDIVPPEKNREEPTHTEDADDPESTPIPIHRHTGDHEERSIRNITPARTRPNERRPMPPNLGGSRRRTGSRWWLWILASVSIIALAVLLLLALRSTTVTVVPRTHALTFGPETTFTAYPEATAATGTLSYVVRTTDLEDSEVVPSQGTVHAEEKASGNITIFNDYNTSPVKLIKNTRFATQAGLIFRAPSDIVVPGKKGSTPGQITVTVIADQPGQQYNVAPSNFTVPGLQSTPAMFKGVYAQSTEAMTGGFVGEKPGVVQADLEAAIATVRSRLESKVHESITGRANGKIVLSDLVRIEYLDMPQTTEAGGKVRIHEKAHVSIPEFDESAFARAVGRSAIGDSDTAPVSFIAGKDFAAHTTATSTILGVQEIPFTLSGAAQIVWQVDSAALAKALAGRSESAFETVVKGFQGVQEARARIQPFWKSTFPADPSSITIKVSSPSGQ